MRHELTASPVDLTVLLSQQLYSCPDVFLRELVCNSFDAIQRLKACDRRAAERARILVQVRRDGAVEIEDDGIGMSETELVSFLSCIGRSETCSNDAEDCIGRFGLGFLSVLGVADEVTVSTRRFASEDSQGLRWCWRGGISYQLSQESKVGHGTRVSIRLKPDFRGLAKPKRLADLVRRYTPLLPAPVEVTPLGDPRPWFRGGRKFGRFSDESVSLLADLLPQLGKCLHVFCGYTAEGVEYCLGFPDSSELEAGGFVCCQQGVRVPLGDRGLLPSGWEWLCGIVDTRGGSLSLSRDGFVEDGANRQIQRGILFAVAQELGNLAVGGRRLFKRILALHSLQIARALISNSTLFREAARRYVFQTTRGALDFAELLSHADRRRGMWRIIFMRGTPEQDVRWPAAESQGVLVVSLQSDSEKELLGNLAEEHGNVELLELSWGQSSALRAIEISPSPPMQKWLSRIQQLVEGEGLCVEPLLVHDRQILSALEISGLSAGMNQPDANPMFQAITQFTSSLKAAVGADVEHFGKLFVNTEHELLEKLPRSNCPLSLALALLLANGAACSGVRLEAGWRGLLHRLTSNAFEALLEAPSSRDPSGHVVCFFAHDFKRHKGILKALRVILEAAPYYWEVRSADELISEPQIFGNVIEQIKRSDVLVGEITNSNPNVLMEIGIAYSLLGPRRVFLLCEQGSRSFSNLEGFIYCPIEPGLSNTAQPTKSLIEHVGEWFASQKDLKALRRRQPYLGFRTLVAEGLLKESSALVLTRRFPDPYQFLDAGCDDLSHEVPIRKAILRRCQEALHRRLQWHDEWVTTGTNK